MQGPDGGNINQIFQQLFSSDLEPVQYQQHPSDEVLSSYLRKKLPRGIQSPETTLNRVSQSEENIEWHSTEVTTHLLTCLRCKQRFELVRDHLPAGEWSFGLGSLLERLFAGIRQQLNPVPRPALATMAIQLLIIAGLGTWIITQPVISNSAATANNSLAASAGLTSLPDPGPVFSPSDLSSFSSLDTQARLRKAKEWGQSGDSRLLEPLANFWASEQNPLIRQELWQALTNHLTRTQGQLTRTMQQIQLLINQYRAMGNYPSADEMSTLTKSFNQIFHQFESLDLENDVVYCRQTTSLSSAQIYQVARDTGATISFDSFGTTGSFAVTLPTINPSQALQEIESRLGFACNN